MSNIGHQHFKSVISSLLPTYLISNIRHQHSYHPVKSSEIMENVKTLQKGGVIVILSCGDFDVNTRLRLVV